MGIIDTIKTIKNVQTEDVIMVLIGKLWYSLKNNFSPHTTESHMMKNSEWGAGTRVVCIVK